mgnify:CR=1 FL=1
MADIHGPRLTVLRRADDPPPAAAAFPARRLHCCPACSRWATCSAATPASSHAARRLRVGGAVHRLRLRPRHARRAHRAADRHRRATFGVEFDSLADVISFGLAPGHPDATRGGLSPLGRLGLAARLPLRERGRACGWRGSTSRAAPDATSGISSACRARRPPACSRQPSTPYPSGLSDYRAALPVAGDGAGAGRADGQHDPVPRSFKTIDLQMPAAVTGAHCHRRRHRRHLGAPARSAGDHLLHLPGVRVHRHRHHPVPFPGRPNCSRRNAVAVACSRHGRSFDLRRLHAWHRRRVDAGDRDGFCDGAQDGAALDASIAPSAMTRRAGAVARSAGGAAAGADRHVARKPA